MQKFLVYSGLKRIFSTDIFLIKGLTPVEIVRFTTVEDILFHT